jgi:hypothetical protein
VLMHGDKEVSHETAGAADRAAIGGTVRAGGR